MHGASAGVRLEAGEDQSAVIQLRQGAGADLFVIPDGPRVRLKAMAKWPTVKRSVQISQLMSQT